MKLERLSAPSATERAALAAGIDWFASSGEELATEWSDVLRVSPIHSGDDDFALGSPGALMAGREGALPLSFDQRRLWLLNQLKPESPVDTVPLALALEGDLEVWALAAALHTVVERHEALRTRFVAWADRDGEPIEVIHPPPATVLELLPEVDLLGLPTVARETEVQRLSGAYASPPLDLVAGDRLASLLGHWRRTLAGEPVVTELPVDRPRPTAQGMGGAMRRIVLSTALAVGVHALARSRTAMPFMVLGAAFEILLARLAIADSGRRLAELPLLSPAERHQMTMEWSGAAVPEIVSGTFVHELFAACAAAVPEAPAALGYGRVLTYGELDRWSNRLARHLQSLGVGPEKRVAIFLERSPEMLAALLGVLKAGGAFVPLDPDCPAERLAYLRTDSGAQVVLTTEALEARLPAAPGRAFRLVRLDADRAKIARRSARPLRSALLPEHPAYILYTSGSRGKPKGAVIPHGSFAAFSLGIADVLGLIPADRFLLFSFGVSVEEIFPALSTGASVVLRHPDDLTTGAGLLRALAEEEVTAVELPAAFWHEWVYELGRSGAALPLSLRLLLIAGEALPARLAAWREVGLTLFHVSGLTEVTCASILYRIEPAGPAGPSPSTLLPIGRPFGGHRAYVLGDGMAAVSAGVAGELHLGGAGLAREYLGDPELTAARFIPSPYGVGERLCKTGDLARFRAGGGLELLGRRDHQVKIRGFRVELGEIEAALVALPDVREAVVVTRRFGPGDERLIAYLVIANPSLGLGATAREFRGRLAAILPSYMVPLHFVALAELPLSSNGKVDRRALPMPADAAGEADVGHIAPRNSVEEVLAAIWAALLKVGRVGIDDNFFERGGHSLLASELVSRVRDAFGVDLPLRTVFEEPTVAGLATAMTLKQDGLGVPSQARVYRKSPLPLAFTQQRLRFPHEMDPLVVAYNVAMPLLLRGALDVVAFYGVLDALVARHEVLRTRFVIQDGKPIQVIDPPFALTLPPPAVVDLAALAAGASHAELRRLEAEEALRPFDLERGPRLRAIGVRLAAEEWVALFTLDHVVCDGWSASVLVDEFSAFYAAQARSKAADLPSRPVKYERVEQLSEVSVAAAPLEVESEAAPLPTSVFEPSESVVERNLMCSWTALLDRPQLRDLALFEPQLLDARAGRSLILSAEASAILTPGEAIGNMEGCAIIPSNAWNGRLLLSCNQSQLLFLNPGTSRSIRGFLSEVAFSGFCGRYNILIWRELCKERMYRRTGGFPQRRLLLAVVKAFSIAVIDIASLLAIWKAREVRRWQQRLACADLRVLKSHLIQVRSMGYEAWNSGQLLSSIFIRPSHSGVRIAREISQFSLFHVLVEAKPSREYFADIVIFSEDGRSSLSLSKQCDSSHKLRESCDGVKENVFREFFELYRRSLSLFFVRHGADEEDICDLVQETFLVAYSSWTDFCGRSTPKTWLIGIAKNIWRAKLRYHKRIKREAHLVSLEAPPNDEGCGWSFDAEAESGCPLTECLRSEMARGLRRSLNRLPTRMREMMLLFMCGLKYKEIAFRMNVSMNTVRSQIHAAREKLRVGLQDYYSPEDQSGADILERRRGAGVGVPVRTGDGEIEMGKGGSHACRSGKVPFNPVSRGMDLTLTRDLTGGAFGVRVSHPVTSAAGRSSRCKNLVGSIPREGRLQFLSSSPLVTTNKDDGIDTQYVEGIGRREAGLLS